MILSCRFYRSRAYSSYLRNVHAPASRFWMRHGWGHAAVMRRYEALGVWMDTVHCTPETLGRACRIWYRCAERDHARTIGTMSVPDLGQLDELAGLSRDELWNRTAGMLRSWCDRMDPFRAVMVSCALSRLTYGIEDFDDVLLENDWMHPRKHIRARLSDRMLMRRMNRWVNSISSRTTRS